MLFIDDKLNEQSEIYVQFYYRLTTFLKQNMYETPNNESFYSYCITDETLNHLKFIADETCEEYTFEFNRSSWKPPTKHV